MGIKDDLTGRRFERLLVVRLDHMHRSGSMWECLCDCGTKRIARGNHLKDGNVRSCGCLARERSSEVHLTHGMSHTPEHRAWAQMTYRCGNARCRYYKHYGGRGI